MVGAFNNTVSLSTEKLLRSDGPGRRARCFCDICDAQIWCVLHGGKPCDATVENTHNGSEPSSSEGTLDPNRFDPRFEATNCDIATVYN